MTPPDAPSTAGPDAIRALIAKWQVLVRMDRRNITSDGLMDTNSYVKGMADARALCADELEALAPSLADAQRRLEAELEAANQHVRILHAAAETGRLAVIAARAREAALREALLSARVYVESYYSAKGLTAGMAEQEVARINAALASPSPVPDTRAETAEGKDCHEWTRADIERRRAEFRREVYDKLRVVHDGANALPLQRTIALKQCQEFLIELFNSGLAASRASTEADLARVTQERDELKEAYEETASFLSGANDDLARVTQALRTLSWRPIDTAPKDSRAVMGLTWNKIVHPIFWSTSRAEWVWCADGYHAGTTPRLIGWMPLPSSDLVSAALASSRPPSAAGTETTKT